MHNLTDKIINKKISILMIVFGLVLLGTISFFFIPIGLYPNTLYPGLTLQTEWHGMGPTKIEDELTIPLEEIISTVNGIKEITSTSEEGKSKINIEFSRETDIDLKGLDIRTRVDLISPGFHREVQEPVLLQYDPTQRPVIIIGLISKNRTLPDLREIAERDIKELLEGIPEVSEVFIAGGRAREILVDIDIDSLKAHKQSLNQILNQLQVQNINSSAGRIHSLGRQYSVYLKGRFKSIQDIRNLYIPTEDSSKRISLSDIATINYSYREAESASRVNGEERVSIYIHKAGTGNLLNISKEVKKRLKKIDYQDLEFEIIYNQAKIIKKVIRSFFNAAIMGISFAFFIVLFFLRSFLISFIMILIIPFSFLITSFFMYVFKIHYNIVTLTGIILSTGIVLSYSILIVYSILQFGLKDGVNRIYSEIGISILLISAVFLPMVFSSAEMKTKYGGLALTIFFTLSSSYFLCITIIPILFSKKSRFLKSTSFLENFYNAKFKSLKSSKRYPFNKKILAYFFLLFPGKYLKGIFLIIKNSKISIVLYIIILISIVLFFSLSKKEFVNLLAENEITASVEFDSGTNFEITNKNTKKIEKILTNVAGVKKITARIDPAHSSLILKLEDKVLPSDSLISVLKEKVKDIQAAKVFFSQSGDAKSLKNIVIDVFGKDIEIIDRIVRIFSNEASKLLKKDLESIVFHYKAPRPEYKIIIDRKKAQKIGISAMEIGQSIRYGIQGGVATKFIERNREVDVKIRFKEKFRNSISSLEKFSIKTPNDKFVPLMELASIKKTMAPVKIFRKNKKRVLSFAIRLHSDANIGVVFQKLDNLKNKFPLPENYRIEYNRKIKEILKTEKQFLLVLMISFLIIYMIIASYFESLTKPILLMIPIPVPVFGVLLFLNLFEIPLSMQVYMGIILISGVIVNDGIIIIKHISLFQIAKDKYSKKSFETFFNMIKNVFNEHIPVLLIISLVLFSFFLPLAFIHGTGGALLKGVAITMLIGTLVSVITTPIIISSLYYKYCNRSR